jgi:hypothetical protein
VVAALLLLVVELTQAAVQVELPQMLVALV